PSLSPGSFDLAVGSWRPRALENWMASPAETSTGSAHPSASAATAPVGNHDGLKMFIRLGLRAISKLRQTFPRKHKARGIRQLSERRRTQNVQTRAGIPPRPPTRQARMPGAKKESI